VCEGEGRCSCDEATRAPRVAYVHVCGQQIDRRARSRVAVGGDSDFQGLYQRVKGAKIPEIRHLEVKHQIHETLALEHLI
jgi:hypothetical protein